MYGEHFDVPAPDRLVLDQLVRGRRGLSSGCCYERGRGRIFTSDLATRRIRRTTTRASDG